MSEVTNKRSRGRPPAFDRQTALTRAMEAFWALGFDGASIPALTGAMGISAQSLYAAFGSKDALYREAIDLYLHTNGSFVADAFTEEDDAVSAVTRVLREAAVVYTQQAASGCMVTMAPSGTGDDSQSSFGRRLRADGIRAIKERLVRGVYEKQLKKTIDCDSWARFVAGTLYGFSVQARDGASTETLRALADIVAQGLEALRNNMRH